MRRCYTKLEKETCSSFNSRANTANYSEKVFFFLYIRSIEERSSVFRKVSIKWKIVSEDKQIKCEGVGGGRGREGGDEIALSSILHEVVIPIRPVREK